METEKPIPQTALDRGLIAGSIWLAFCAPIGIGMLVAILHQPDPHPSIWGKDAPLNQVLHEGKNKAYFSDGKHSPPCFPFGATAGPFNIESGAPEMSRCYIEQ